MSRVMDINAMNAKTIGALSALPPRTVPRYTCTVGWTRCTVDRYADIAGRDLLGLRAGASLPIRNSEAVVSDDATASITRLKADHTEKAVP